MLVLLYMFCIVLFERLVMLASQSWHSLGSMQQLYAEYSEIFISVKENTRRVPCGGCGCWKTLTKNHQKSPAQFKIIVCWHKNGVLEMGFNVL